METIEDNNQDTCNGNLPQKDPPIKERCWSILNNNDAINEEGCRFFVNPKKPIYLSSYELRWFTYEFSDEEKQKTQKKARDVIHTEATQPSNKTEEFEISILLYSDPTKWKEKGIETKYIEDLLDCQGVVVKYLDTKEDKQLLRISLSGKKLLLSTSKVQENKVRKGFLYEANTDGSLLLEIFEKRFIQDFDRAKKIKLDNNRNIVFADNRFTRYKKWRKSERGTAITWSIISAIFGTILGAGVSLLLKHNGLL